MRHTATIAIAAMLLWGLAPASAHDRYRIIGTIAEQQASMLVVTTRDGRTISVALRSHTFILRDDEKSERSALKLGSDVVVEALGDSEDDLFALTVRIVPPPAAPTN